MPDWVTHLGTTYLAARAVARVRPAWAEWFDPRYLLLGALLPDATRFTIILVDVLHWPAVVTFTYLIPFHSLLSVALLAAAIAILMPVRSNLDCNLDARQSQNSNLQSGLLVSGRHAFSLVMAGAVWHFLLDEVEGLVGCGSTTFYPFYFGKPINAWDTEGQFATFLLVLAAIALGLALARRQQYPPLTLRLTRRRVISAVALVMVTLTLPLFFRQWMIERNAYYLGFVTHPAAFEGKSVELCFSEVIAANPPTIEEFDAPFVLRTSTPLTIGEWVSVRGIYETGAIRPTTLIRHRGFADVSLSLVAAAIFGLLMVDKWNWHSIKQKFFRHGLQD